MFVRVYRLEIQPDMLLFSTQLCKLLPPSSNLLSGSTSPAPPPLPVSKYSTVGGWEWGGVGVLSCVGDYILQEFNTLFLTRFRTYKIARPPPNKNLGGEGASDMQINTCRKVPLQVNFLDDDILLWCLHVVN